MKLYLVQHGKAVDKKTDPDRPLSVEGAQEVRTIGSFFAKRPLSVEQVWHSGKTRARQTAELLAKAAGPNADLVMREGLSPDDEVKPVARELSKRNADLMIVGHLPWLSKLAGLLLTGQDGAGPIAFTYAGVVCLERSGDDAWHVKWIIIPELVSG